MKKQLFMALAIISQMAYAQSIWDVNRLASVRENTTSHTFLAITAEAETLLEQQPVSVIMKDRTAVSGDKHDYLSLSRYFWPDPTKPDGRLSRWKNESLGMTLTGRKKMITKLFQIQEEYLLIQPLRLILHLHLRLHLNR